MKVSKSQQSRNMIVDLGNMNVDLGNINVDIGKDQDLVNLTPASQQAKANPPCGIKSPAGINRAQHDIRPTLAWKF